MPDIEGRQWAAVVFGPAALLLAVVAVGYGGVFVVPGGPCTGAGGLTPPTAEFAVASNGSAVTVVHVGNGSVGGPTTDRLVVSIRDAESGETVSRHWIRGNESIERGDTLAIPASAADFELTGRDRVAVQWYGIDPDAPNFCPNGRAFEELTLVRLENASTLLETGG